MPPGKRHLPVINMRQPEADGEPFLRGRISPCNGCMNQTPVPPDANSDVRLDVKNWPCPKSILYAHKEWAKASGDAQSAQTANFDHPVYDDSLRSLNPIPAGLKKHKNPYAYAFIATYEDNVDTGWNPTFNTETIRCRGPFLIAMPERLINILGKLEQGDHILAFSRYYYVDGASFKGFLIEAATWQVHTGSARRTDTNLIGTTSGVSNG